MHFTWFLDKEKAVHTERFFLIAINIITGDLLEFIASNGYLTTINLSSFIIC